MMRARLYRDYNKRSDGVSDPLCIYRWQCAIDLRNPSDATPTNFEIAIEFGMLTESL